MFQVTINNQKTFTTESKDDQVLIDGDPFQWEILAGDGRHFKILVGASVFNAEMLGYEAATKSMELKINGKLVKIDIKDDMDLLLDRLGIDHQLTAQVSNVKAPMPGLIIEVAVSEESEVKVGDPLLVLEAMKMENVIKSPADGIIKMVNVKKGESVEKNQILVEFKI